MSLREAGGSNPLRIYNLPDHVKALSTKQATPQGWVAALKGLLNKGLASQDEIEWTGIIGWLNSQNGKVSKDAVLDYLDANGIKVTEVILRDGPDEGSFGTTYLESKESWAIVNQAGDIVEADFETEDEAQMNIERFAKRAGDGGTKYHTYVIPGGTNYREVLLTLQEKVSPTSDAGIAKWYEQTFGASIEDDAGPDWRNRRDEFIAEMNKVDREDKGGFATYRSSHWDQPNVLAHIRVNDRTDAEGRRVLFVEEIQSDWGQQGKREGFGSRPTEGWSAEKESASTGNGGSDGFIWRVYDEAGDRVGCTIWSATQEDAIKRVAQNLKTNRVPSAPFVTKTDGWLNLALKRVITMAAQEGYDRVAFINGSQSAERYQLSKQIDRVDYYSDERLIAYATDGRRVIDSRVKPEDLARRIGKEAAERLMEAPPQKVDDSVSQGMGASTKRVLTNAELKLGGEGMKTFYDQIVPAAVRKLAGKIGAETDSVDLGYFEASLMEFESAEERERFEANISNDRLIQLGLTITKAVRERVAQGPTPLNRLEQTNTPAFRKWFGDSKVVDDQGRPMVVYHGTIVREDTETVKGMGDIQAFDRMFTTKFRAHSLDTVGSWFSTNPGDGGAQMYAGGGAGSTIYPVYLSIKNPHETTFLLLERRARLLANGKDDGRKVGEAEVNALRKWLKAMDKDGIKIVHDEYNERGSTEFKYQDAWIALEPEQIKSAVGNSGHFDPENPDICDRKMMAPSDLDEWIIGSVVTNNDGSPKLVYRGEHGKLKNGHMQTRVGTFTFTEDRGVAEVYAREPNDYSMTAEQPRILEAYLSIKRPIISNPNDPFIDLTHLAEKMGEEFTLKMARKHADHITNTGNWAENFSSYAGVNDLLQARPDAWRELYMDVYPILDDREFVEAARAAGYDGAMHIGNGVSAGEIEYRVFSSDQVRLHKITDVHAERSANTDRYGPVFGKSEIAYRKLLAEQERYLADPSAFFEIPLKQMADELESKFEIGPFPNNGPGGRLMFLDRDGKRIQIKDMPPEARPLAERYARLEEQYGDAQGGYPPDFMETYYAEQELFDLPKTDRQKVVDLLMEAMRAARDGFDPDEGEPRQRQRG
jgi:hypothetical protein